MLTNFKFTRYGHLEPTDIAKRPIELVDRNLQQITRLLATLDWKHDNSRKQNLTGRCL